ncbi:unnamed protein product [Acanthocheilonema viteae]|uniref:Uncharacterized protein n=1 Tax=Acanthocheilonema viteae TaxID=6277 RepID=A0A498SVG9_ACAVI|nr:unnamed protein product [Acanthocheilonema viteae]
MANSPTEKHGYTKDRKKDDVDKTKDRGRDDDNEEMKEDDNDDAALLSQAINEKDWNVPSQPDKTSFLSDTLREGLLKQFDEIPFAGDAYLLTQEINRLRKQLGDSLGENQMLEQDLRTKEFRNRLNNTASVTETNHAEVLLYIFFHVTEPSGSGRQEPPVIRLKKVSIPSFQRGNRFSRTWNDSPVLRKAFAHCKLILNDTFHAIDSQGKPINNTTFIQHDTKSNRTTQTSQQELQISNPNLYNCLVYLRPDNQLAQFYGACDEIVTMGFRNISSELLRDRKWKTTRLMHDILVEPRKRWCR